MLNLRKKHKGHRRRFSTHYLGNETDHTRAMKKKLHPKTYLSVYANKTRKAQYKNGHHETTKLYGLRRSDIKLRNESNRQFIAMNKSLKPRKMSSHNKLLKENSSKMNSIENIYKNVMVRKSFTLKVTDKSKRPRVMTKSRIIAEHIAYPTSPTIPGHENAHKFTRNRVMSNRQNRIIESVIHLNNFYKILTQVSKNLSNTDRNRFENGLTTKQPRLETFAEHKTKKGRHILINESKVKHELLHIVSPNDVFSVVTEPIKITNSSNESVLKINAFDGNKSAIFKEAKPILLANSLSDHKLERKNLTIQREGRVTKEDYGSPQQAYHKAVNFMEKLFRHSPLQSIILAVTLSASLLILLGIIIAIFIRRFRNSKKENDDKLNGKNDSRNNKNRKKCRDSKSFLFPKKFQDKDESSYFSICSDSGSLSDEGEDVPCRSKNSPNKKFVETYYSSSAGRNETVLPRKVSPKASENPSSKLSRLHRSLSMRTGIICNGDVSKRAKLSPLYECDRYPSHKGISPANDCDSFRLPSIHSEDEDTLNEDYSNNIIENKRAFVRDVKDNKVYLFSNGKGGKDVVDPSNPFCETFQLQEE